MKKSLNCYFKRVLGGMVLGIMCFFALFSTACSTPEALWIGAEIRWRYDNVPIERTVYEVTRQNSEKKTIASGTLTYTVRLDNESSLFVLTSNLALTYDETRTDTITSTSVFTRTGLKPVYLKKRREIKGEIPYDGFYTLSPLDNYEFEAVYSDFTLDGTSYEKGASGTFLRSSESRISMSMSHSAPEYYCDSEYLFYFVRSVNGIGLGYSKSFGVTDVFASFAKTKPALGVSTMNLVVSAEERNVSISNSVCSESGSGLMLKAEMEEGGTGKVAALRATLSLASGNSGTSIVAYYSSPISENTETLANNRLILLGFDTEELTAVNFNTPLYTMQYRLTSLSNTLS